MLTNLPTVAQLSCSEYPRQPLKTTRMSVRACTFNAYFPSASRPIVTHTHTHTRTHARTHTHTHTHTPTHAHTHTHTPAHTCQRPTCPTHCAVHKSPVAVSTELVKLSALYLSVTFFEKGGRRTGVSPLNIYIYIY